MKKLAFLLIAVAFFAGSQKAEAQFGRNYWRLDADTLKVVSPNWYIAAQNFIPIIGGTTNLFFGYRSGYSITSGTFNVGLGYNALYNTTHGSGNVGIGYHALYSNTVGNNLSVFGYLALASDTSGNGLSAFGTQALSDDETGDYCSAFGAGALLRNLSGSYLCAFGYDALENLTSGKYSVALGAWAGRGSNGDGNVFIGYGAGSDETGSDKLYIANSATTTPLIWGDFSADSLRVNGDASVSGGVSISGNVGIGVASPNGKLDVSGAGGGTISNGTSPLFYLHSTSSYAGASFGAPTGQNVFLEYLQDTTKTGALLYNNAFGGNNNTANFALESFGVPLWLSASGSNNGNAMVITTTGNVGIGTTTPNSKLQVGGVITADSTILSGGYVSTPSDQSFTNSTTATNITGLSVPLSANTTYSFTAQLFTSVAANAGEATSVYYGGNTPSYVIYGIVAEDNSVIDVSNWTNTIGTPFSDNTGSAVTPMVKVQGTITTGSTAANLTIRYAQSTAQTSSNTVKRGSWLHVWQTH